MTPKYDIEEMEQRIVYTDEMIEYCEKSLIHLKEHKTMLKKMLKKSKKGAKEE